MTCTGAISQMFRLSGGGWTQFLAVIEAFAAEVTAQGVTVAM